MKPFANYKDNIKRQKKLGNERQRIQYRKLKTYLKCTQILC